MGISSSKTPPGRLIMLGLDAAGKTTLLYKMKCGAVTTTIPTIGFNVESLSLSPRTDLVCWDIGGRSPMRPLWRHYLSGAQGIVFVVDSADRDRMEQASEELARLLESEELRETPVLLLANKTDLPSAMPLAEVSEAMRMSSHERGRPCASFAVCAVTFEGAVEAFSWLSTQIKAGSHKQQLEKTSPEVIGAESSKLYHLFESHLPKTLQRYLLA